MFNILLLLLSSDGFNLFLLVHFIDCRKHIEYNLKSERMKICYLNFKALLDFGVFFNLCGKLLAFENFVFYVFLLLFKLFILFTQGTNILIYRVLLIIIILELAYDLSQEILFNLIRLPLVFVSQIDFNSRKTRLDEILKDFIVSFDFFAELFKMCCARIRIYNDWSWTSILLTVSFEFIWIKEASWLGFEEICTTFRPLNKWA